MIRFPAPVERPNPYAVFVDTFLQAKAMKEQQNQAKQRLKMQEDEAAAQVEARKAAVEQAKEAAELRKAEFEFTKTDTDRKFKLSELKSRMDLAESMKNFRKPAGGSFQLQLPPMMEGGEAPMVEPVFHDDIAAEAAATDARRAGYDRELRALPTPPPAAVPLQGMRIPGIPQGVESVDPRLLDAATSRANNAASIAGARERQRSSPMDRVAIRDGVGNVTGMWNKETNEYIPVPTGPQMRTTAIPVSELRRLDEGAEALQAVEEIKWQTQEFQNINTLTSPFEKAKAGIALNTTVTAMSRTVGRSLGEKGVFTDGDKEDFKTFLAPNIVYSTLSPGERTKRIEVAERLMTKLIRHRANNFYSRYGMLPEDKKHYLDPVGPGATPRVDPGGLF